LNQRAFDPFRFSGIDRIALAAFALSLLAACSREPAGRTASGPEPGAAAAPAAAGQPGPGAACALLTQEEVGAAFAVTVTSVEPSVSNSGQVFYCLYKSAGARPGLHTTFNPTDRVGLAAENAKLYEPVAGIGDAASYDEKQGAVWVTKAGKLFNVYGGFGEAPAKEALIAVARKAAARL
jgi:hypothetical protein